MLIYWLSFFLPVIGRSLGGHHGFQQDQPRGRQPEGAPGRWSLEV